MTARIDRVRGGEQVDPHALLAVADADVCHRGYHAAAAMKAIVYTRYGTADALGLRDVATPEPRPSEVRVAVRAVSLNGSDAEFLSGSPLYARFAGLFRPRRTYHVLGSDVAGVVDAVGRAVTDLAPGDEVYGDIFEHFGGLAERVCAPRNRWVRKPAALSFEDAATLPQAGGLAWQGICREGAVPRGGRALVIGAGGGVGTFAVQLAKQLEVEVTAVDGPSKIELLRRLGCDRVVDYTKEAYAAPGDDYDLILDIAGRRSVRALRRSLAPAGRLLIVGGLLRHILGAVWLGLVARLTSSRQSLGILPWDRDPGLVEPLAERVLAGTLRPEIDMVVPLERAPEGFARMLRGEARGKVVVTVGAARLDRRDQRA